MTLVYYNKIVSARSA